MNIKGGTQTWSNAQQQSGLKGDNTQSISATDREKHFRDDAIGDILNKVTDPNYVDPSKKMRTTGNNEMGKDAFMTLLLTQMKNQDPTNPLKSHEMAAQLAQFTSLEKLQGINDGIENLRKDQAPEQNFQALSFIGKSVTTDNSKVSRLEKDERHDIRFTLPADAQKMSMQIKDAEGNVVRTLDFKAMKAGKNEVNWNGANDEGAQAPLGDYTASFEAIGSNGRKLHVETKTEGIISGVNFTPRGPQLMIGKQVISMADVKEISQPQAEMFDAGAVHLPTPNEAPGLGPKKAEVKTESKPDSDKRAKLKQGNLNDSAMAQGLINTLEKEGAKAGMGL